MEIFIEEASYNDTLKVDNLLTKLIQDERKYDKNINKNYIVKNFYNKFINKSDSCIAVAKTKSKEIIGYCFVFIEDCGNIYNEKIVQLDALFVEPSYRDNGIAQKLINYITEWSKEKDAKYIELKVCNNNKNAIKLYNKFEFKQSKRILSKKLDK